LLFSPVISFVSLVVVVNGPSKTKHTSPQINQNKAAYCISQKKKPNTEEQQQELIETRLLAAADCNNDDDDSTSTGSRETSSESEEDNKKPKATSPQTPQTPITPSTKTCSMPTQSSPRIIDKIRETAKMFLRQTDLEPSISGAKEKVVVMSRAHSMFMNCVPLTKDQLGSDVLEKICSIIQNSLFKSAKFYPMLNHVDAVVGLCLYDCDFHVPGVQGDFARAKVWDAV